MVTVGACSLCGGPVQVPEAWSGSMPPTKRCAHCGATAKPSFPLDLVLLMQPRPQRNDIDTLPDIPDLAKKLGHQDAVFDAWRDRQDDRSWVRLDLSALRIGYELGRCAGEFPDAPSDAITLNKACDAGGERRED